MVEHQLITDTDITDILISVPIPIILVHRYLCSLSHQVCVCLVLGLRQICWHNKKHNGLAYWVDNMKYGSIFSNWGEPERAPLKREVGTVVHARKTTAKSGLPHTTVSLVGWFIRNDKRINYVKSIQVHM